MLSKAEIKYIKSLHIKKYRQKYSKFIVQGHKSVLDLLTTDYKIDHIYILFGHNFDVKKFKNVSFVTEHEMKSLSNFNSIPTILAIVNCKEHSNIIDFEMSNMILVLDEIQDPGNLGTIIRTADWYGIKTIICSENCADLYNSKTISATMGSLGRVQIFYCNLYDFLITRSETKLAATLKGDNCKNYKRNNPLFLIIGNEGKGINNNLLELADNEISIIQKGSAESLNVAIATAVLIDNLI